MQSKKNTFKKNWKEYWPLYFLAFFFFIILTFSVLFFKEKKNRKEKEKNEYYSSENFTIVDEKNQDKKWIDNLAFQEIVLEELKIWMNNLKLPLYQENGDDIEIDKHLLFYGPPGSGKSFLAEEIAKNMSSAFKKANYETIIYVGSSVDLQKKDFDEAKKLAENERKNAIREKREIRPVIIIMDELDSYGRKIKDSSSNHTSQEVNSLLRIIDEAKNYSIIFIGITNYEKELEEALTRSGRLGKKIKILYPSTEIEIKNMINYLEKKFKSGYKSSVGKKKIVKWPDNFWSEVHQITLNFERKHQNDEIGFSSIDLQSAINDCLAMNLDEIIIPKIEDYEKRLRLIIQSKIDALN